MLIYIHNKNAPLSRLSEGGPPVITENITRNPPCSRLRQREGGGGASHYSHPFCTPFPPHEQLLVAAVGGAVVVVDLRHYLSSWGRVMCRRDVVALAWGRLCELLVPREFKPKNKRNILVSLRKKNEQKKNLTVGPNDAITSFGPGCHSCELLSPRELQPRKTKETY